MKILATSDLHGQMPSIDPCDILIIAGDSCDVMLSHRSADQAVWLRQRFIPWLEEVPATDIILIAGNHDFCFEKFEDLWQALPQNVTYLKDSAAEVQGLKVYGTPWIPNLKDWAFYGDDQHLDTMFSRIPKDLDVLVAHGPPMGISDRAVYEHTGSIQMRNAIKRVKPKLMVCGHIHEGFGLYMLDSIAIANVAYLDRDYEPTHNIVDLSELINE